MKLFCKFWIVAIAFIVFLNSCENGKLKDSEVLETKKLIIEKGDRFAYYALLTYYNGKNENELIMPYSLIMAYKYNHRDAYFSIYESTITLYNDNSFDYTLIKNLDSQAKDLALKSLIKSADLGYPTAKKYLAKYYREGVFLPKNIELAQKLENEIKIR